MVPPARGRPRRLSEWRSFPSGSTVVPMSTPHPHSAADLALAPVLIGIERNLARLRDGADLEFALALALNDDASWYHSAAERAPGCCRPLSARSTCTGGRSAPRRTGTGWRSPTVSTTCRSCWAGGLPATSRTASPRSSPCAELADGPAGERPGPAGEKTAGGTALGRAGGPVRLPADREPGQHRPERGAAHPGPRPARHLQRPAVDRQLLHHGVCGPAARGGQPRRPGGTEADVPGGPGRLRGRRRGPRSRDRWACSSPPGPAWASAAR